MRACHGSASTSGLAIEKQLIAEFDRSPASAAQAISRLPEVYRSQILTAIVADHPEPGSPRYLRKLFKQADNNNDGILDPYAFPSAMVCFYLCAVGLNDRCKATCSHAKSIGLFLAQSATRCISRSREARMTENSPLLA
jgi:hypothetical protein